MRKQTIEGTSPVVASMLFAFSLALNGFIQTQTGSGMVLRGRLALCHDSFAVGLSRE